MSEIVNETIIINKANHRYIINKQLSFHFNRNPSQVDRLSFDSICHYYSDTSEESLLTWEKDDIDKSPRASEIGAPISEGYRLYTELQHEYRDDTNFI